MRAAFIAALEEAARSDDRIWLLSGDLGFSIVEGFRKEFPDRFVNMGVAEQDMLGVAAGLAMSGKVVFAYSIANFAVMRCLEQIRNDVCYHDLPVRVVSVGGGLDYGAQGYTHHGVEDLAVMRAMPNMTVLAPADQVEVRQLVAALETLPGPAYVRLGKTSRNHVHMGGCAVRIGRAITVRDGRDVTLVSTGAVLGIAVDVAEALCEQGIEARVLNMHTVKPIDAEALDAAARETALVVTLEDHSVVGGLGAAVLESLAAHRVRVLVRGLPDVPSGVAGSADYLRASAGFTAARIASDIARVLSDGA